MKCRVSTICTIQFSPLWVFRTSQAEGGDHLDEKPLKKTLDPRKSGGWLNRRLLPESAAFHVTLEWAPGPWSQNRTEIWNLAFPHKGAQTGSRCLDASCTAATDMGCVFLLCWHGCLLLTGQGLWATNSFWTPSHGGWTRDAIRNFMGEENNHCKSMWIINLKCKVEKNTKPDEHVRTCCTDKSVQDSLPSILGLKYPSDKTKWH